MTNEDRNLIQAFVENGPMFEAVRSALLTGMIGEDFSRSNWVFSIDKSLSDTAYGKQVRITAEALRWIEAGFSNLKRLGASNPQPHDANEAR